MQSKGFSFEVKQVGERGEIEGYASVFNNIDLGGDIVMPGAFSKTISDGRVGVPILWGHSMQELIGVNKEMREDSTGLYVKGELNLEVSRGREVYSLAKQGAVTGLSIGYQAVKYELREDDGKMWPTRLLKEVKLFEYSLTPVPMNEEARITRVKDFDGFIRDLKEGRTISKATRERLQRMADEITSLLAADEAEADNEQGEPQKQALIEQLTNLKEVYGKCH